MPAPTLVSASGANGAAVAQIAQRIHQVVEVEKSALQQSVVAQRSMMIQDAQAKAGAIEAEGAAKVAAILASVQARRGELQQSFAGAQAAVQQQIATQKDAARADGAKALSDLHKTIDDKRKAATDAAEAEAAAIDQAGQIQAQRASSSADATESAVGTATTGATASVASSEAKIKDAVRDALQQTAGDIKGKVRQHSTDLAKNATNTAHTTSSDLRAAGAKVAASIGEKTSDVENGIRENTQGTIASIDGIGAQQHNKLEGLKTKALASLDQVAQHVAPGIQQVIHAAAAKARESGDAGAAQLDTIAASIASALDAGGQTAISQLGHFPPGKPVPTAAAEEYAQGAAGKLRETRTLAAGKLGEHAQAVTTDLGSLHAQLTAGIGQHEQRIQTQLSAAVTSTTGGLAGVETSVTQQCQKAITAAQDANKQSIQKYGDELQTKVDEAKTGWIKERTSAESSIRENVDKGLAGHVDLRAQLPAQMTTVANDAASSASSGWLSQVLSGIWSGIKKFAEGLIPFVIAFLVVLVVVLAFVSGVGEAAMIALAIVGVAFMIYGFITAMIARSKEFWSISGATDLPWYMQIVGFVGVLGVAIADTFGVGPLLEGALGFDLITGKDLTPEQRAERITQGALTIALMFLLHGVVKKIGGVDAPGVDPNAPKPVDPNAPGVDPNAPKPVDPNAPGVDPNAPKPVDPNAPKPDEPNTPKPSRALGLSDRATKALAKMENIKADPVGDVNSIPNHNHYAAARAEAAGDVVARKADGTPFDHIQDLQQGYSGLDNVRLALEAEMRNPPDTMTERGLQVLLDKYSEVQAIMSRLKGFLDSIGQGRFPPYHQWPPGT